MRPLPFTAALTGALAATLLASTATAAGTTPMKAIRVTTGLNRPVWIGSPPADYERVFVGEQGGKIRIVKNGTLLAASFIDLGPAGSGVASSGSGERGLLGIAFHPDYATNRQFYVHYTQSGTNDTVVQMYKANAANPDLADPGGTTVFGPYFQPQTNHNGGGLAFSPVDGMLYLGLGDGGGSNDTGFGHAAGGNGQSTATLLGKILRFDIDIAFPHIPPSNPYVGVVGEDLIYHWGIRNPWRLSFDSLNGDMYIGDVGQFAREEISFAPAGASNLNFGWRCMEGFNCSGLSGCTCNAPSLTLPIHDYSLAGAPCAVVGGIMYRGCAMPDMNGTYFFADHCLFVMASFEFDGSTVTNFTNRTTELTPTTGSVTLFSSFGEDAYGEIYFTDLGGGAGNGELFKIVPDTSIDCNANLVEDSCDIASGNSADCNSNGVPDECENLATSYCTAGSTANGCTATLSSTGVPSISSTSGFVVDAATVEGSKDGIFFYGFNGPQANNWGSGTSFQCVIPPVIRSPIMSGVGTNGACDGSFSLDLTGYWSTAAPSKVPSAGGQVNLQLWFRDPQNTSNQTTSLSDGLEFTACP
jgi:glucose/arabinose dehydrogenase